MIRPFRNNSDNTVEIRGHVSIRVFRGDNFGKGDSLPK